MIVTRYLTREIVNALLVVTTVLLLAFLSQQLVRYLNFVAIGKIPTDVLLLLVSFEIPYLLALLLPLGLYLGILLAFGRLYADNEMFILQMSGFGTRRTLRLSMIVAFFVAAVVLALMMWVNPAISAKRQQIMSSDEATVHLVQTLIPGRFQASPDGRHVMYVEKLSRDRKRAESVFLAQEKKADTPEKEKPGETKEKKADTPEAPEQNSWMLVIADQGYQVKDRQSKEQYFVTADGYRYEGVPGQNDFKIIQFKKYYVRIPQADMQAVHQEVESLSTWQLWLTYANPKSAAELQWRFSIALSAFLLAMLAVPLSKVRPRQGRYLMLLPAVIVYVIYIQLLSIARHWMEQGTVSINLGMWWVHGVMLFFILSVLFFSVRWRR